MLVGNGGDELIFNMLLAWGGPGRTLIDMPPTFAMYGIDAQVTGTELVSIPRVDDFAIDERGRARAPCRRGCRHRDHRPTPTTRRATWSPETFLIDILNATDALVLVDEAYFEFSRHTMRPHMERHPNLVHPADVLQGVLACGTAAWATCSATRMSCGS